jgi:hypothetical protein
MALVVFLRGVNWNTIVRIAGMLNRSGSGSE